MAKKVVIIGAMALGPKAACRFKRLEPESRVIIVDQDKHLFYDPSGIPYFISGDVSGPEQLQSTSFFMPRDKRFFRDAKDLEVIANTKALRIDREKKCVLVQNILNGEEKSLPYDKLVLATGSRFRRPPLPGLDLEGVFPVYRITDAKALKDLVAGGKVAKPLVMGGSILGLQIAEALADMWGIETTVIESRGQLMSEHISKNLAHMVQHHMQENGISFYLSEHVKRLDGGKQVERVVTDKRILEADSVIMAMGVEPNADLARDAGLEVSSSGAVVVNKRMQTSDPDIYAGGECVEIPSLITERPGYYPYLAIAHRQGRVIGTNLAGGDAEFAGAAGSFVVKLFEISIAGAGLNVEMARREGLDAISATVVQFDRAHYYPEKDLMCLELVVEKDSGRVLGIQGLGNKGDGTVGRIDAVAGILGYKPTTHDISNLELAYSPPFSGAMDILNTLGNVAENMLAGKNRGLDVEEFKALWASRENGETFFLDSRGQANAEPFVKRYPLHWKSIPQDELRDRAGEVPRDRKVVLICNTGMRSYEAQVILDQMGIRDNFNLQGGMAAIMKWGLDL